jgi:glycosyltransferase involved in cell wall biosynthesis
VKVLVLNYEYPPVGGGGGRLCRRVCEALAERGHEVRVVTAGVGSLPRHETMAGVEVFRPRSFRRREDTCSVAEMGFYLVTAFPAANGHARRWRPDVMHAHFVVPTGVLALALKTLTGLPYVITAHLGDVPGGVPEQTGGLFRLAMPIARAVWHRAAARTAVSGHVAQLATTAFGKPGEIIPNGLPAIPEPPARPHGRYLEAVWAGRFSIQKNPLLAVNALRAVPDAIPVRLRMIGAGPLYDEARQAAADLGNRITFCGWLPEERVRAIFAESDVLVMTSLHEGLPMVGVEALWHGLAILGTRIGGLADVVIENQNGALLDSSPHAFAQALTELASNPSLLASRRAASRTLAPRFDFENSINRYETVLAQAAKPLSPPT